MTFQFQSFLNQLTINQNEPNSSCNLNYINQPVEPIFKEQCKALKPYKSIKHSNTVIQPKHRFFCINFNLLCYIENQRTINILSLQNMKLQLCITPHQGKIVDIIFLPDSQAPNNQQGNILATCDENGVLIITKITINLDKQILKEQILFQENFTVIGYFKKVYWSSLTLLALVTEKEILMIQLSQEIPDGLLKLQKFNINQYEENVTDFAFSDNYSIIIAIFDRNNLKVMNRDTLQVIREFHPHEPTVDKVLIFKSLTPRINYEQNKQVPQDFPLKEIFITLNNNLEVKVWDMSEWIPDHNSYKCLQEVSLRDKPQEEEEDQKNQQTNQIMACFDNTKNLLMILEPQHQLNKIHCMHINPDFYSYDEKWQQTKKLSRFFDQGKRYQISNQQNITQINLQSYETEEDYDNFQYFQDSYQQNKFSYQPQTFQISSKSVILIAAFCNSQINFYYNNELLVEKQQYQPLMSMQQLGFINPVEDPNLNKLEKSSSLPDAKKVPASDELQQQYQQQFEQQQQAQIQQNVTQQIRYPPSIPKIFEECMNQQINEGNMMPNSMNNLDQIEQVQTEMLQKVYQQQLQQQQLQQQQQQQKMQQQKVSSQPNNSINQEKQKNDGQYSYLIQQYAQKENEDQQLQQTELYQQKQQKKEKQQYIQQQKVGQTASITTGHEKQYIKQTQGSSYQKNLESENKKNKIQNQQQQQQQQQQQSQQQPTQTKKTKKNEQTNKLKKQNSSDSSEERRYPKNKNITKYHQQQQGVDYQNDNQDEQPFYYGDNYQQYPQQQQQYRKDQYYEKKQQYQYDSSEQIQKEKLLLDLIDAKITEKETNKIKQDIQQIIREEVKDAIKVEFAQQFENQVTPCFEKYLQKVMESANKTFESGIQFYVERLDNEKEKNKQMQEQLANQVQFCMKIQNTLNENIQSNVATFGHIQTELKEKTNYQEIFKQRITELFTSQKEIQDKFEQLLESQNKIISSLNTLIKQQQQQQQQLQMQHHQSKDQKIKQEERDIEDELATQQNGSFHILQPLKFDEKKSQSQQQLQETKKPEKEDKLNTQNINKNIDLFNTLNATFQQQQQQQQQQTQQIQNQPINTLQPNLNQILFNPNQMYMQQYSPDFQNMMQMHPMMHYPQQMYQNYQSMPNFLQPQLMPQQNNRRIYNQTQTNNLPQQVINPLFNSQTMPTFQAPVMGPHASQQQQQQQTLVQKTTSEGSSNTVEVNLNQQ